MKRTINDALSAVALLVPVAVAQESVQGTAEQAAVEQAAVEQDAAGDREPDRESESDYGSAAQQVRAQLAEAVAELDAVRERIAAEKIPMSRRLSELENELMQVRTEYQQTRRMLDGRTLDLSNLENEIEAREEEASYLRGLLGEYVRNFESRLHVVELGRYEEALDAARLAPENRELEEQEVFQRQANLLDVSLQRLEEALGGTRFRGTAVVPGGLVGEGTFVLVGPAALFLSDSGNVVGTAEQRLGSLEPSVIEFADEQDVAAAREFVETGAGAMPIDTTLGNAHKIDATQESLLEHVKKGGPVMIPIFAMAGLALLVALYKWLRLAFLRRPSARRVRNLLASVEEGDEEAARSAVARMKGPVGRMLRTGVEHMREPADLVEEVMYEHVLTARLKLNRMLPFIAICAAAAPLLGLLGTVTGIINTFKMITVFGSGDVKALSGGISEALITTKFGLIVAIPSLLLHAFLSRKARGVIGQMETAAVTFVNRLAKSKQHRRVTTRSDEIPRGDGAPDPDLVREQVNAIVGEMLGPLSEEDRRELASAASNDRA